MGLLAKEKEIVVPGDELAEGMDFLPGQGAYREGDKIMAGRLGLLAVDGRAVKIIPLSGRYIPKKGDTVIGQVIDVQLSGWRMEINSAYTAVLNMKDASSDFIPRGADLTKYFDIGEYVATKIINVTSQKLVDVTMKAPGGLKKLVGGRIIKVAPTKVPRIIGKGGSMVTMIKDSTGCRISVGQNGLVWIQGEPEKEILCAKAIEKIQSESHLSGLTEKIKAFLQGETNDVR